MAHEEVYTKLSLGASTEDLLAQDESWKVKGASCAGETALDEEEAAITTRKRQRRYLSIVKNIVLYALAIWGLFALFREGFQMTIQQNIHQDHHHHHETVNQDYEHGLSTFKPPGSCRCGDSVAEALSLGCKYDSLAVAWLPPHCRDDELTAEFESEGTGPNASWTYWADNKHTHELSVEEVGALGDDLSQPLFYMDYDWHIVHCAFYWIKQYRALTRTDGKIMEPRNQNEGHIRHCMGILRNRDWGTAAWVVFNTDSGP